jgi:hypothetical protein
METWDNSTVLRRTRFENSHGNTGVLSIEARINQRGTIDIRLERAPHIPQTAWTDLMLRIEGRLRVKAGSDSQLYTPAYGTVHTGDRYDVTDRHFIIRNIPFDSLNAGLAAVLGGLSTGIDVRDGKGITKPLLDNAAIAKALHELELDPFVAELKARGHGATQR